MYKGDLDVFLRYVLLAEESEDNGSSQTIPNAALQALGIDMMYRSEMFPSLHGNCFAGLDDGGVLSIFSGHPADYDYRIVWSTTPPVLQSHKDQFQMQLTNDGELIIWVLRDNYLSFNMQHGSSSSRWGSVPPRELVCAWSTSSSSCNANEALLRKTLVHTRNILSRQWIPIKHLLAKFNIHFQLLLTKLTSTYAWKHVHDCLQKCRTYSEAQKQKLAVHLSNLFRNALSRLKLTEHWKRANRKLVKKYHNMWRYLRKNFPWR